MKRRAGLAAFAGLGFVLVGAAAATVVACGGQTLDPRYPPRPQGCAITTFPDAPNVAADNIGSVRSWCNEEATDEDCYRSLKDEACKMGADIIWGVPDKPVPNGDRRELHGRAAHTHVPQPKSP